MYSFLPIAYALQTSTLKCYFKQINDNSQLRWYHPITIRFIMVSAKDAVVKVISEFTCAIFVL